VARIFKPTYTIPIPADAEFVTHNDRPHARLRRKGKIILAPVTKQGAHAGKRVTVETAYWAIEYIDASGKPKRVKGFTDRRATEQRAADIERGIARQSAGIIDPQSVDLSRQLQSGIEQHFSAYEAHLQAAGASPKYMRDALRRLRTLATGCKFENLAAIKTEPVHRWLNTRTSEGMGPRTQNTYREILRAFVRWCIDDGRMISDPLTTLARADEASDIRRKRRALTESELERLLSVASARPLAEYGRPHIPKPDNARRSKRDTWTNGPLTAKNFVECVKRARERLRLKPHLVSRLERLGRERELVYRVLVLTGLRRGELAGLTWADLDLYEPESGSTGKPRPAKQARLTVRASISKNGKTDTLPVRADLADRLRDWKTDSGSLEPNARVFNVPAALFKILDRDLAAAGIPKRDPEGRTIDVHAMRHTTASYLARGGVAPRAAQSLMRHSDIRLTLGTYTDPTLLDSAAALAALPKLGDGSDREQLRATGTDAADSLGGLLGGNLRPGVHSGALDGAARVSLGDDSTNRNSNETRDLASQCSQNQNRARRDLNPQPTGSKPATLSN
jgi:integrase